MKIAIAGDHGGFDLKEKVKEHLMSRGFEVRDFGCFDKTSCDYPDFGKPAAQAVSNGECDFGVLICTTGIGMSMVANKVKGVRAALCGDLLSASLTRLHNNANVLVMGAGIVGDELAIRITDTFFDTEFSNEERHKRRINKIEG
ncbi:MAG: ribose 5-phosphate isomerase B [Lachnospiraceae bacterium]|nr:ribose 5-phosphate isomerase B [Lachnospiraceae bacterium]